MLIPFTSSFRRRFSGTGKNGPSASLLSRRVGTLAQNPQAVDPVLSRESTSLSALRAERRRRLPN